MIQNANRNYLWEKLLGDYHCSTLLSTFFVNYCELENTKKSYFKPKNVIPYIHGTLLIVQNFGKLTSFCE